MLLIPAIDLKEGRCVRLRQGRMSDATEFSDDPEAVAEGWAAAGCQRLHLVDLDGAFAGAPVNQKLIARIVRRVPEVLVQVGGGIRSEQTARAYFEAGAERVIVGTRAVQEPSFLAALAAAHPGRVLLGLDARNGKAATQGWDRATEQSALEIATAASALELAGIVYTDILRDGMLSGLNIEATLALAEATALPVIASGGLHDLADLARLKAADDQAGRRLAGVIAGRSLYAGTLDFRAGQALLRRLQDTRSLLAVRAASMK